MTNSKKGLSNMGLEILVPHVYPVNLEEWGINKDFQEPEATTEAFNKAFTYAKNMGYFEVWVPPGNFLIDGVNESNVYATENGGGIHLHSNTHYKLNPESVFKINANDAQGYSVFYIGLAYNVTLEGGQLIGDRHEHDYSTVTQNRNTHEFGFGVNVHGSERVNIINVRSRDMTGDNILITNKGNMNYPGQTYIPSKNVTVDNCYLETARRNNLSAVGCDGVLINNCDFIAAGGDVIGPQLGIDFEGYAENGIKYAHPYNLQLKNSRFRDNGRGCFTAHAVGKAIISENFFDDRVSYGFGTDISIVDNHIINDGEVRDLAIDSIQPPSYDNANRVKIAGNKIKGFKKGMTIRGKEIDVTDNDLNNITETGIHVYLAEEITLNENRVNSDCVPLNIQISKKVNVSDNTFKGGAEKYGVIVSGEVEDISFKDNHIEAGGGINAGSAKNVRILSKNEIFVKGKLNALRNNPGSTVKVNGLNIYDPAAYPMELDGSAGTLDIKNVSIYGCKAFIAINIKNGRRHKIKNNDIVFEREKNGGYGVYLSGTERTKLTDNDVSTSNDFAIEAPFHTEGSMYSTIMYNYYDSGVIKNNGTDRVEANDLI
ncbi:unnamed protein product [Bacillus phage SPP1]|uniref:Bacteriophage SPP1 complete nucleotide sequence n=1 Tax=Bacillus phage SPP1 TaxID=10724 RepID=O48488_BPSPP|nr:tail spike protein [Bacillus phage SPP1]CAA66535.1 unnamed protein product [Bacillus phage SPP1]